MMPEATLSNFRGLIPRDTTVSAHASWRAVGEAARYGPLAREIDLVDSVGPDFARCFGEAQLLKILSEQGEPKL